MANQLVLEMTKRFVATKKGFNCDNDLGSKCSFLTFFLPGQRFPHSEHLQGRREGCGVLRQEGALRPRDLRQQARRRRRKGRAVNNEIERTRK